MCIKYNMERRAHPSQAQLETLIQFLETHPGLAKGFSKIASAKAHAHQEWANLALNLNSLGSGCVKSPKRWIKYWSDKKSAVKKKAAARNAQRRKTGGGVGELVELTDIEERIITLMGGEGFVVGDPGLLINPFPNEQDDSPSILNPPVSIPTHTTTQIISDVEMPGPSTQEQNIQFFFNPDNLEISNIQEVVQHDTDNTQCSPMIPTAVELPASVARCPSTVPFTQEPQPSSVGSTPSRRHRHREPRVRRRLRVQGSPPAQRRSQLMSVAEKFLNFEGQRLEVDRRLVSVFDRSVEKDILLAQAIGEGQKVIGEGQKVIGEGQKAIGVGLNSIGEGLKAIAQAINK